MKKGKFTKKEAHKIFERDGWRCKNPMCDSETPWLLDFAPHHIDGRSREYSNGITLCKYCHDKIHSRGNLRVYGTAPDNLTWEEGFKKTQWSR